MVNKQGQTRLAQYFEHATVKQRENLESEVVRKCLARGEHQVEYSSIVQQLTQMLNIFCI